MRFRIAIPKGSYVPSVERRPEEIAGDPAATGTENGLAAVPIGRASGRRRALVWGLSRACFWPAFWPARRLLDRYGLGVGTPRSGGREDLSLDAAVRHVGRHVASRFRLRHLLHESGIPAHPHLSQFGHGPLFGPLERSVGAPVRISPSDPNVDPEIVRLGSGFIFNTGWTGTGEVLASFRLTKLFTEAGQPVKVIRSRSLTYDAMRDTNVIFLGSPWGNDLQDKVNPGPTPLVCNNKGQIVNSNPRPGEQASYTWESDPDTQALTVSYALISVLPGVTPGTKIVSSAGIDTYGTSAGIEFLTSTAGVSALLGRFDPHGQRSLPEFFQAVIRTRIVKDDQAARRSFWFGK